MCCKVAPGVEVICAVLCHHSVIMFWLIDRYELWREASHFGMAGHICAVWWHQEWKQYVL